MNVYFLAAAILLFVLGASHSFLGERWVLGPMARLEELPALLGSRNFMLWTLKFTWHVTTALLWGLTAILLWAAITESPLGTIGLILAVTLTVCAGISVFVARGMNSAWALFFLAAIAVWLGL